MEICKLLKKQKLLCDGAFGTYYAELTGSNELSEKANIQNPEMVKHIHKEYILAGARLLRTNTFACHTRILKCSQDELVRFIQRGYDLAVEAVNEAGKNQEQIYIAGDIGPIVDTQASREECKQEYELICDTFIEKGAKILVFETFSDLEVIDEVIRKVKGEHPELFIIVQFCMNQYGYSASGKSAKKLMDIAEQIEEIDAVGYNCGVGPSHLYHHLKKLHLNTNKFLTAFPNASYPTLRQNRMAFIENVDYFAKQLEEISKLGIHMLGGCCGTSPKYINALRHEMDWEAAPLHTKVTEEGAIETAVSKTNYFFECKKPGDKILAVELSPPIDTNYEKIMDAANELKQSGVDIITFPDSPSGRMRADSILMSAKVASEVKINVMPHICCRDRNAIAIRSALLGAHINGIKNFLVVTGDPVPAAIRQDVKNVFNFDSVGIMKTIEEMNEEQFKNDPIVYGGAVCYNRRNIEVEINRMEKKIAAGAKFFLSQPVFTSRDVEKLRYMKTRVNARILCGIMPLVSIRNARFIKNEMADIHVTEEIVNLFTPEMTKEEGEAVGVGIARQMLEETKDFADGYYFSIPFNRVYLLKQIIG